MYQLSIRIHEKLASLSSTVPFHPYIFRVDELLHKENKKAYEPEMLSIGPYHRNKEHLQMMEKHKLRYLREFLEQRNESMVDRYIQALLELAEIAWNCYAGPVELDRDEFVEMMLFDGIFIIKLLQGGRDILQSDRIQKILVRDMLLFENQLPLFVLKRLSGLANEPGFTVEGALLSYIAERTILRVRNEFTSPPTEIFLHHPLGVMHYGMRPSFLDHLEDDNICYSELPRCATELQEAGIKFKLDGVTDSWMDIEFKNGSMRIPTMFIDDDTEKFVRNLIAYEQYNHEEEWMYVTSYVKFMNCLIKSPNDVKILQRCGSFEIGGGMDDKSTVSMFTKLSAAVIVRNYKFCYFEICNQISMYHERRQNRWMANWRHNSGIWMAKLKQDYFNSPWSVISLIGAFVLLVLTAIQTVCSTSLIHC